MKGVLLLTVGVAVGFVVAHQVAKTAQGKQFFDDVDAKAREFGGAVVDGYKAREAELRAAVANAEGRDRRPGQARQGLVHRPAPSAGGPHPRLARTLSRNPVQTADIQRRWLTFFGERGHTVVPSASLVSDDPTLLFTVAGMVPFIPYLTGVVPAPYPRADERAEVHPHPRHRRGRQDPAARHVLPDERQLLLRRLLQGAGDRLRLGAAHDVRGRWRPRLRTRRTSGSPSTRTTTRPIALWKKIAGLPDERIQRLGMDDNYWSTGQPGPAGPCSEIFFDRGPAYGRDGGPATDDDRYVEIWNLVFMQYLIAEVQSKIDFDIVGELPKKNIDTGMGMERVAFLKQGVENMYEIDQVRPVLDVAAELSRPPLRRRPRRRRAHARHRRPRALEPDAHDRRRDARQRGPRLHPAPPAAPRRARDAPARASTRRASPSCSPRRATR